MLRSMLTWLICDSQLSMATLGTLFGGVWLATRGGDKKKKEQGPPINASSKDEEQFIQCVYPFFPFPRGMRASIEMNNE